MPRMNEAAFIARLEPMLAHQVELYKADPAAYVRDLPIRISGHFHEHRPDRLISLAYVMACSLLATHRIPTAASIARLMAIAPPPSDGTVWQPHLDPELASYWQ